MKILIAYYSFTGNTRKVAFAFSDYLKSKGRDVQLLELKLEKEPRRFLTQVLAVFVRKNARLSLPVKYDLLDYDRIILGSPVWALSPVPAVRSYILNTKNIKGKNIYLFVTYGSGLGKTKALDIMGSLIEKKGARILGKLAIWGKKTGDLDYLRGLFQEELSFKI